MPLAPTTKSAIAGAVVGAVLGFAFTFGTAVWHYYEVDKPALLQAQGAQAAAEKLAADRETKLETLQAKAKKLQHDFEIAKEHFISQVTDAVNDGVAPVPGGEPHHPVPEAIKERELVARARRIVDTRDRSRQDIQAVTTDLTQISEQLDSNIDALKHLIDNPPVDPRKLQALLRTIADSWQAKLKLIEALAANSLQQIGCPMQFALNP